MGKRQAAGVRHLGAQTAIDGPEFAWVPLEQLKVWVRNPRKNASAVKKVASSIRQFGWVRPIIVNTHEGCENEIIVGHTARLAATELGLAEVPVRFVRMPHEQAHAAAIADNKLGEISGWDDELLRSILTEGIVGAELFELAGFNQSEIDRLGKPATAPDDEVPERPKKPVTQPGDLWVLGRHRLVCGDSTDASTVGTVLDGASPKLMITDPPYGVNYDANWRNEAAAKGHLAYADRRVGKVQNDDRADWSAAWALFAGDVAYVWHAAGPLSIVVGLNLQAAGFELRPQLMWAKTHFAIGRGHYHVQHEPCWFGVRKGRTASWIGNRKQTTLWEIKWDANVDGGHSTQKPVECMARPMRNHSGDVFEPFCGSGTTLVAAEQLERTCYAIELDTGYCDVIVERWQKLTGGKAVRTAGLVKPPPKRPPLAVIKGGKTRHSTGADRSRTRARKG